MPRGQNVQTLDLPGFTGGLNRDADPFQLEPTESPDALNVDFGLRGAVSKRSGYSQVTTSQAEVNHKVIVWDIQGGATKKVAVAADGDIWDYTGTPTEIDAVTWSAPSDEEDWPIGVASLNNVLYLTNMRGDAPIKWDGTTLTVMTATIFDGTASRFPKAKYILSAHDRMFAANVDDGTSKYRSRLHFSNVLDAETWDAADYIDFTPDDGQEITGVAQFGEDIVVFKNHNVQLLSGATTDSFTRFVVDSGVGTTSPRSIKPLGPNLIFFDADSGVHGFDGNGFELLSMKINDYLLDGINYSYAYKAHAFVYRRKYYLSVPWGADTHNSRMFVFDDQTKAWTEYDLGVLSAAIDGQTVFAVGTKNDDGMQQLFSTLNDDGAAIEAYVKTPWLSVNDDPEMKARIRRSDFAFSARSNSLVTVDMYRNFDSSASYISQTLDADPGGALFGTAVFGTDRFGFGSEQVLRLTTGWGKRFRTVQFKIGTSDTGNDFQLNRLTLHVSTLGSVRGEM